MDVSAILTEVVHSYSPILAAKWDRRLYPSISHLPGSFLGKGQRYASDRMRHICLGQRRDKHDEIIIQEKIDGIGIFVGRTGELLYAMDMYGNMLNNSNYSVKWNNTIYDLHWFVEWLEENDYRFMHVLFSGEFLYGMWVAQVVGTRYDLDNPFREPFIALDIFQGSERMPYDMFLERLRRVQNSVEYHNDDFSIPHLFHRGDSLNMDQSLTLLKEYDGERFTEFLAEGLVWRVERKGRVDFLAQYVREKSYQKQNIVYNWHRELWNT